MLDAATIAFIVITAEDEEADGELLSMVSVFQGTFRRRLMT